MTPALPTPLTYATEQTTCAVCNLLIRRGGVLAWRDGRPIHSRCQACQTCHLIVCDCKGTPT